MTQKEMRAREWKSASKAVDRLGGKPLNRKGREPKGRGVYGQIEVAGAKLPRKASNKERCTRTKTDTGRQGENPKVREKTLVKELGKMHP